MLNRNELYLEIMNNKQFDVYYEFLVSENQKYNLTSITEKKEVFVKHFLDSISLLSFIDMNENISICDVGSGAGFPIMPIKILRPDLKVTIIEPTLKRCNFLNKLIDLLKLENINIINDRAEAIKDKCFDIVCARAVSSLPILLEICTPLLKINGMFYAYKGNRYLEEIEMSKNALKELNCRYMRTFEYDLDKYLENCGQHYIIEIQKIGQTRSIYPRAYAQIKKKPL